MKVARSSRCVPVLVPSHPCSMHCLCTHYLMTCSNQTPFNELWIYTEAILNGSPHIGLVGLKLLTTHHSISKWNIPPVVWFIGPSIATYHAQKVGLFLQFVKILPRKAPRLCARESDRQRRTSLFTYLLSIWCLNISLDLWNNVESDDNFENWSCSCFNWSWDTSIVLMVFASFSMAFHDFYLS